MKADLSIKKITLLPLFLIGILAGHAQKLGYQDSLKKYMAAYIEDHEVIKGSDKIFLDFFPINKSYRISSHFSPLKKTPWFTLPTSSGKTKTYRKYGKLSFKVKGVRQSLYIYQAQALLDKPEYWDYLFLPFMDKTNGIDTYETGRYLDFKISDIRKGKMVIDFNKAYNPYCAYISGVYNCPVPPKENNLSVEISAGEKKYKKPH